MPYKRKAAPYRRKRKAVYRKKRTMRRRQNNPSKMMYKPRKALGAVAPERYLTKLKGTWLASTAATAGRVIYEPFGNSPFDFQGSGGTQNASGLTQLAALYNRYVVYGSKIVAEVLNSTTVNKYVILFPLQGNSPSNTRSAIDAPYAKSKMLGANTGQGKVVLSNYMSTKRLFGAKDLKDDEKNTALTTTTPSDTWAWNLWIDNNTGSGTDADTVRITITYYVEFYERIQVNES